MNQADETPAPAPQQVVEQNGQDIIESEVQQGYSEVDIQEHQQQVSQEQQVQEEVQMNGTHPEQSETDHVTNSQISMEVISNSVVT